VIETPIALDALVFIVYPRNPVEGLTTENIRDIYTGKTTKWSELGVEVFPDSPQYSEIYPLIRNANSGSQELMDLLIMKDLEYIDLPEYEEQLIFTMAGLIDAIAGNPLAIGYTVYYYNKYIIRPDKSYLKTIAIDGVEPDEQTLANHLYPYTTEVYAVIRSDTDKNSMAYKIYEWLQTTTGKETIKNSGYIPVP
jgi:phosphate transport system substrate-binding protein